MRPAGPSSFPIVFRYLAEKARGSLPADSLGDLRQCTCGYLEKSNRAPLSAPRRRVAMKRRILIDGTSARGGGGVTYLMNVVPQLSALSPDASFLVAVRNERLGRSLQTGSNVELLELADANIAKRLGYTFLELPRLARRWRADLYFSVSEMVPMTLPCPSIASFRNANLFTTLALGWPIGQKIRMATLWGLARLAARRCDRILFVSEDSANWIGASIRLPESRRAVIHHGIDAAAWSQATPYAGHPRPYILSVSSIYRYKNFVRLIEAYADLARRVPEVPDLVIIGDDQDPPYSKQMTAARAATGDLAERIHILGEIPYADVKSYYAGAALFAFPSYLETFGHPLLEAMAARVPVVASDMPIFREIAGDAALYADPHDTQSISNTLEAALAPDRREELIRLGARRVELYTWERAVTRLLALFDGVLEERRAD